MDDNFLPYAFFENKFIKFKDAKISIATHALHYGTAAFGGLRGTINPKNKKEVFLFRLKDHIKRFCSSAKFLHHQLNEKEVYENIIQFIQKNQPKKNFYIRPLVYASGLGISPRLHNLEKEILIYGLEMDDYLKTDGVTCRISSWYRQEDRSLPLRGKISGAYITSSLAKTEAVESGFDEAILMNTQGKVCEATGMNFFIVRDDKIITSGFDQDILEGITRQSVIKISKDLGFEVIQRAVDKTELFISDEVFLTGTAAKITPVTKIENYNLPKNNPITNKLKDILTKINLNEEPVYQDWVTTVTL
jgi:branched-chain amino acid aminotransferase